MVDPDGTESEYEISELIIEPYFWDHRAHPTVMFITTEDEGGKTIRRNMLRVSGASGKLQLIDRSKSVRPQYDLDKYGDKTKAKDTK